MKCIDRCLDFGDLHHSHKIGYYTLLKDRLPHQNQDSKDTDRHQRALDYTEALVTKVKVDIWCEAIDMGYSYPSLSPPFTRLQEPASEYLYIDQDPDTFALFRAYLSIGKQQASIDSFDFISTCYSIFKSITND